MKPALRDSLSPQLITWDGRSTAPLSQLHLCHKHHSDFTDSLIALAQRSDCEKAATWLLKYHLEQGNLLTPPAAATLIHTLPDFKHWESKLHVLQLLSHLTIETSCKQSLEGFLRQHLGDSNKFVKAWSYNGLFTLAKQYPEYRREFRELIELAKQNEPASVKARIRNIEKQIAREEHW